MLLSSSGCRSGLGRPCPEHVSGGALSVTWSGWSFRAKAGPRAACWTTATCGSPSWLEDDRLKLRRKSGKPVESRVLGLDAPKKAPQYPVPCVPSGVRSLVEPVPSLSRRWGREPYLRVVRDFHCRLPNYTPGATFTGLSISLAFKRLRKTLESRQEF